MATETSSNLHAAVKYDGAADAILARTGIASVTKNGVGDYTIVLTTGVGINGDVRTVALEGVDPGLVSVSRDDATTFQVRITEAQVAVDRTINVSFKALTNRG